MNNMTIELNDQQVELLKELLREANEAGLSNTVHTVIVQIINKLTN